MKIILLQDEKKLGKKGDVIEASEGFARNYILPKKIGVEATAKNLNDLKLHKANEDKLAKEQLDAAKALAAELEQKQVTVKIKAGEGGRAFGSVSSKEIAAACKEQHNIEIDKKKIQLAAIMMEAASAGDGKADCESSRELGSGEPAGKHSLSAENGGRR